MNILMVAAENGALPHGKVGGIGDVVRNAPAALAALGHTLQVVTPSYQYFSSLPGALKKASITVDFRGLKEELGVYCVPAKTAVEGVTLWALEHPLFAACGSGVIYCDDPPDRPFATDASKFALFSLAVVEAINRNIFSALDVLHLHDWHAALVAVLRAYHPGYRQLQSVHTVYSIHNLALQGVRPLAGDDSSLDAWYPGLAYDVDTVNDPQVTHCVNPMRAGINLSDKVHTVSPTYAEEILEPSKHAEGFFGGEGLEHDLQRASKDGRLEGILNGCDYAGAEHIKYTFADIMHCADSELLKWIGETATVESAHLIAKDRIARLKSSASKQPTVIVTSVGRITPQKMRLLTQTMADGRSALDVLLEQLANRGILLMLGNGDTDIERFLVRSAASQDNFIFLKGYSEKLAEMLYSMGDLFLMPSSYEPCGISQMLAMRAGQSCLVHQVGGLADTVQHGSNGFAFTGDSSQEQAENMINRFEQVLNVALTNKAEWQLICNNAAAARFLWSASAQQYVRKLYTSTPKD